MIANFTEYKSRETPRFWTHAQWQGLYVLLPTPDDKYITYRIDGKDVEIFAGPTENVEDATAGLRAPRGFSFTVDSQLDYP